MLLTELIIRRIVFFFRDTDVLLTVRIAGVRCLPTESTIQLSLILRAKSWKHVQTSLKQRTISKLAEYFLVPEESITVRDATSNDLHKMVEKALQHGKKPSRTVGKSLGWIGFPVGCGEKMSSSAKETVRNVNTQLAELRDLTAKRRKFLMPTDTITVPVR
uniref:Uncharacterized protein n=1 Tax=Anopheles melas TaxID=34690 RepID=A0A182UAX1_9DIPT